MAHQFRASPSDSDDFLPLSALNDLLFCPRRCALHRIEGLWTDNVHTVLGTQVHKAVHDEGEEVAAGGRVVRGMWLRSERLRLVGVADAVEFRGVVPYPVEYKRGKRRKWDNDEAQLCAQALCLEEMLGVEVPAGAIFHVRSKRRREVRLDEKLRRATEDAVRRLHELVAAEVVPPPVVHPKCKQCSLYATCMPELLTEQNRYQRAARSLFSLPMD
jgi:CRISPR-associated exonuclease Cas4